MGKLANKYILFFFFYFQIFCFTFKKAFVLLHMVLLWSVWVSLIYMWSYLVVLHSSIINMFVYAELLFFYCSVVLWLENVKSACLPIRALDCDFFESVRVKIWRGRTCASAWSALLQSVCAEEPQHIVAGERFHWSSEERRFQRERFSRAWFTPVSHRTRKQSRGSAEAAHMQSGSSVRPLCFHSPHQQEREGARSGRSATEDLVFKLK